MLLLIGRVLTLGKRTVTPANGQPFEKRSVALLVGKARIEWVDLSRDFDASTLVEGEDAALRVSADPYISRPEGSAPDSWRAAYSFTAWEDVTADVTIPARPVPEKV